MHHISLRLLVATVAVFALSESIIYAGPTPDDTSSTTDPAEALLKGKLTEIVKNLVTDAHNGNGGRVKDAISQQYRATLEDISKNLDPTVTVEQNALACFNYYTITAIRRVVVDKDVAFVEAQIAYKPDRLVQIRQDEKQAQEAGRQKGSEWNDFGGASYAPKCEEAGVGLATCQFVLQGEKWKLHFTYFSLSPLTADELADVAGHIRTLVLK